MNEKEKGKGSKEGNNASGDSSQGGGLFWHTSFSHSLSLTLSKGRNRKNETQPGRKGPVFSVWFLCECAVCIVCVQCVQSRWWAVYVQQTTTATMSCHAHSHSLPLPFPSSSLLLLSLCLRHCLSSPIPSLTPFQIVLIKSPLPAPLNLDFPFTDTILAPIMSKIPHGSAPARLPRFLRPESNSSRPEYQQQLFTHLNQLERQRAQEAALADSPFCVLQGTQSTTRDLNRCRPLSSLSLLCSANYFLNAIRAGKKKRGSQAPLAPSPHCTSLPPQTLSPCMVDMFCLTLAGLELKMIISKNKTLTIRLSTLRVK